MWYPAKVTSETVTEPLTLAQARAQCGVASGDTSKDDILNRLIASSRTFVEKYCSIFVPPQEIEVKCDRFSDFERLPFLPLRSVTSVTYVDAAGDVQTMPDSVYEERADGLEAAIVLKFGQVWPQIQPRSRISVVADVGFESVPADLVSAMLLWISSFYSTARADASLKSRSVVGVGAREWDTSGNVESTLRSVVSDLLVNYRCWVTL